MSKGPKKMSKVSTEDLDFDDISGKTTSAKVFTEKELSSETPQPKEVKSSENDYKLAIRLSYNTYQLITLETCTSAEFFQCMSQNYPYMGDSNPDEAFISRQTKVRTLKHVVSFHSETLRPLRTAGQILNKEQRKPLFN